MIPTEVILVNFGLITASCAVWGAVWHFILKEKIRSYNALIDTGKIQIIQILFDHNTIIKAASQPEQQISILKNAVAKLEIIENQRIDSQQTDKFFFYSILSSIVAIILKLIEPEMDGILVANFTFRQVYEFLTFLSALLIFIFIVKIFQANEKIGKFYSVDSIIAFASKESREE